MSRFFSGPGSLDSRVTRTEPMASAGTAAHQLSPQ